MMYHSSLSIVRRPVDTAFTGEMVKAMSLTARENDIWSISKSVKRCDLSLLSNPQIEFAVENTGGSFDVAVVAGEFLQVTDGTPLEPAIATVSSIAFTPGKSRGVRLTAFLESETIENEAKTMHSVLDEQGLTRAPYLAGVHISFGTLSRKFGIKKQNDLLEQLSSRFIGTEVELTPAVLRNSRLNIATYTDLGEIATNGVQGIFESQETGY
jgi:hypothetical protein